MTVPRSSSSRLPALRIGDADRDAAVRNLRQHYADGRLTLEEFLHRLPLALRACTATDLDPLFADLPAVALPPPPAPSRRRTGAARRVFVAAAAAGAVAAGAVAATTWITAPARPADTPMWRYHCSQCVDAVGQEQAGSDSGPASREYQRAVGAAGVAAPPR